MVLTMLNIEDVYTQERCWSRYRRSILVGVVGTICLTALLVLLYSAGVFDAVGFDDGKENDVTAARLLPPNVLRPLPPSSSTLHVFRKAAVCADGPPCAEIGKQILLRNGSAVDATIAALFCNGLVNMQSMGMGGGFLMTIYKKSEGKAYSLNARETAPKLAFANMYRDKPDAAKKGGLSIGVPGELKGYWAAHQKFGRLPWKELILPTIALCDTGYRISIAQKKAMNMSSNLAQGLYKEWFFNNHGEMKNVGDIVYPRQLCQTLRTIAEFGAEDFYTGGLSALILEDLQRAGSLVSADDLRTYEAQWQDPVTIGLSHGERLFSAPLPGSGVLLGYILKILDGYGFTKKSIDGINSTVLTYHRMVEAFKHAYARRTELGDTDFVDIRKLLANLASPDYAEQTRRLIDDRKTDSHPSHYGAVFYDTTGQNGTAHISVLSEEGDAVSVTSTINLYFGSEVISEKTGVTFNCVMDDFSNPGFMNYFGLPGSPNNAVEPGKRPLSSMSPSILVDEKGDVILVIGASGGTQITTGVAQVIARLLWFDQNIKEAVDAPRIHHQVFPMQMNYEYGTLQQIVDGLNALGHNATRLTSYSVVCALMKKGENIFANADHRKGGDVYGIN